ncbi:hypothetical protein GLOTRDRAFT_41055, partial [Gloeophyllum trabeum ATCC 11539]
KHKTTDHACQMFCNPASFSGLVDQNGNWVFNTSIAEQTNVWFGAFQSIVREMEVVRYNFFLDEMVKRRNRWIVEELARKGHGPWHVPADCIMGTQDM